MKKTLLIFLLTTFCINAQSTYNSTDFASVNDNAFISNSTAAGLTLDYTLTGANYNWDYSSLIPQTQDNLSWVNPANTGYKTVWCLLNGYIFNCNSQFNTNFNLATQITDGLVLQGMGLTNIYDHFLKSSTSLSNKMLGAQITMNNTTVPFVLSYTDADELYDFPMNFNDNNTSTFALGADLSTLGIPLQISINGQRIKLVEGWGTLITPFGTFNNTLKLKSTVTQTTSTTYNGTNQTVDQTTITYQWFDPAYKIPVLEASGNEVNGLWVPTSVRYYDIQRCLTPQAAFAFVPLNPDFDPATQTASVSFVNGSSNYDISDWDFGDGTPHSNVKNPTHNYSCPGQKLVTLTVTNSFCNPVETSTITIPVTITDSQNAFATSVTVTDTELIADRSLSSTTYQWLDCDNNNSEISGAVNQSYTPTVSGNYAVQLTTNGCVDVSDCYEFNLLSTTPFDSSKIEIYPNTTNGIINIKGLDKESIKAIGIYNLLGDFITSELNINSVQTGIYILKITTDDTTFYKRIIKK